MGMDVMRWAIQDLENQTDGENQLSSNYEWRNPRRPKRIIRKPHTQIMSTSFLGESLSKLLFLSDPEKVEVLSSA